MSAPVYASGCEFWVDDTPCGREAVETLVFCNPLCVGVPRVPGQMDCCAAHLAEFVSTAGVVA